MDTTAIVEFVLEHKWWIIPFIPVVIGVVVVKILG